MIKIMKKKLTTIAVCLLFVFAGCKKDNPTEELVELMTKAQTEITASADYEQATQIYTHMLTEIQELEKKYPEYKFSNAELSRLEKKQAEVTAAFTKKLEK